MSLTRTLRTLVPQNVRSYLANDATLANFFGTSKIRTREYVEVGAPTPAPYLQIVPGELKDIPTLGGSAKAVYEIGLVAVLPRLAPADDTITAPTAPTSAAGSTGLLTVVRRHAVTYYTATGESFASVESAPLTVTSKKITVTIPTGPAGTVGRRLWATASGLTCLRFLDVVANNSATSYTDEIPDSLLGDEIAPYPGLYGDLMERAKIVLRVNQTLQTRVPAATGIEISDAMVGFIDQKPVIDARNQLVWETRATYNLFYSMLDRQSEIE